MTFWKPLFMAGMERAVWKVLKCQQRVGGKMATVGQGSVELRRGESRSSSNR